MLPIIAQLKTAVTATAVVIWGCSVHNIGQTYCITRSVQLKRMDKADWLVARTNSPADVVGALQGMKRKDLLSLYLHCDEPKFRPTGEWTGVLLDNNGIIMSSIARLITHSLFGSRRRWIGKVFLEPEKGCNRFQDGIRTARHGHKFSVSCEASRISPTSGKAMILRYDKFHNRFSLWNSMVDELRIVYVSPNSDREAVLLGFGSMGWSGGALNSSPFCLCPTACD